MTKMVTISKTTYDELIRDSKILRALEAGGVDNWEWYSESLKDAGLYVDEDDEDYDEIYSEDKEEDE